MKQSNDFIKLHDADTNLPMVVASRNMATIESHEYVGSNGKALKKTLIYFINPLVYGDDTFTSMFVNENVERIYELLYEDSKNK